MMKHKKEAVFLFILGNNIGQCTVGREERKTKVAWNDEKLKFHGKSEISLNLLCFRFCFEKDKTSARERGRILKSMKYPQIFNIKFNLFCYLLKHDVNICFG